MTSQQNIIRCKWAIAKKNIKNNDPFLQVYLDYHDNEWGLPNHDDKKHFEFLILEGAQAGLSWATILKRREGYRLAFCGFDPSKVAKLTDMDLEKLRNNSDIIRNKAKISSARKNAKVFLKIQAEFGSFDKYLWGFNLNKQLVNRWQTESQIPANSKLSDTIAKDLKQRGMSFVGSTIIYSHLQACGLVNDHITTCFRYLECIEK